MTMKKATTGHSAYDTIAAIAAMATVSAADAARDPFFAALAKFHDCDAIWRLHDANPIEELEGLSRAEYAFHKMHDALAVAVETEPTTVTGHAAKLEFLAENPWGDDPETPLYSYVTEDLEWQERICGALRATAEFLRKLPIT